jgi:hypothetical protein
MTADGLTIHDHAELTADRARYWLALDGWTVDEAAHLLCGIAPATDLLEAWVTYVRIGNPWDWTAANGYEHDYEARRTLLQRAGEVGALKFPASPAAVVSWAMAKGMKLPAPLVPAGYTVKGGEWVCASTTAATVPEAVAPAPAGATSTDLSMLATRDRLIAAFGAFTGMDSSWFDNLSDAPALMAARKVRGTAGRRPTEPWFCPYEVMRWLADPRRKKGRPMQEATGWRMLKQHFPAVYSAHELEAPESD